MFQRGKSKQLQVKSEQLQKENDEMEQRIVALRQMMQKEREDRERQGGNRWKSSRIGQDTNSPNAKTERKPTKPKGQPKFKVLSDKPIEKYKSKDSMNINAETLQSSLCGQCERVKAKLECVECGELYCPPCFKQFHSKGAMRKHAWQPVDQERPYSSKNKTENTKQTRVAVSTSRDSSIGQAAPKEAQMEDEDSLQNSGGMLLGGTYNEEESAASFQEALKEWRNSSSNLPSQKNGMWMNPVDEEAKPDSKSCETEIDSSVLPGVTADIKLNFDSSLTYADRLMLKKHKKDPDSTVAYSRPGTKYNSNLLAKKTSSKAINASPKSSRRSPRLGKYKGKDSLNRMKPQASSPNSDASFPKALQIQLLPSDEDESKYGSSDQEGSSPIINYTVEEKPPSRSDRFTLSQMGRLAIVELSFSDPENDPKFKDGSYPARASHSSLSLKRAASGMRNQPSERSRTTPPHGVYSPSAPSNTYVARQKILLEKNRRGANGTESSSSIVKKVLRREDRKWKPRDKYVGLDSFFMAGVEKENIENTSGDHNDNSKSSVVADSKNFPTISIGLADSWRPESSLSQVEENSVHGNKLSDSKLKGNSSRNGKTLPHGIRVTVENLPSSLVEADQSSTMAAKSPRIAKSELTADENGTPRVSMTDFDFLSAMPPMPKGDDLHKLHRASTVTLFALSPQPPDVWNDDSELEIPNSPLNKKCENMEMHINEKDGKKATSNETEDDLALKELAKDILQVKCASENKGLQKVVDNNWEEDSLSIEDNDAGSGLTSSADGDTCYESEDSDLDLQEKKQVLNLK
ncbi:uncharacterized protein LOC135684850 isoform X2 [Rhopilema esculentum]|uniref:uncharacterized protein LOC135684850 isoform X2 n=1 Tax=Rhopilema esculentum TaxID=499914 RepID=UPI0031DF464A